jgi:hypothetical protein
VRQHLACHFGQSRRLSHHACPMSATSLTGNWCSPYPQYDPARYHVNLRRSVLHLLIRESEERTMSKRYGSILIVGAFVASLLLGIMPVSAMQDISSQPDIAAAPQPGPPASSKSDSTVGQSQENEAVFWQHARDPFAPPDASKLCARGLIQACALVTPSD